MLTETEWREKMSALQSEARAGSMDDMLEKVMSEPHDYGTVCVAIGGLAAAMVSAADRTTPNGGITGFQAGAIFWEFTKALRIFEDGPKKMVQYGQMLYPQYERHFDLTITPETWQWLKETAQKKMDEGGHDRTHPDVWAHWQSIASGKVPFGYRVAEE